MAIRKLTLARLREVLHYDTATGEFTWKVRLSDNVPPGRTAGARGAIGIDGAYYRVARLAWFYINGEWPDHRIFRACDNKNSSSLSDLSPTRTPKLRRDELTADVLRKFLRYDLQTGEFFWVRKTRPKTAIGCVAGTRNANGYTYITLFKTTHLAHRLAWLYMTGDWPRCQIDHIDGDRRNNRWNNLRDVPLSGNAQNRRVPRVDSKTGVIGVEKRGNRFRASITYDGGTSKYLGMFGTAEEAHAAYVKAKRELHDFNTL